MQKRASLALAALVLIVVYIALFGRAATSRIWSNAGMLALNQALRSLDSGAPPRETLRQAESLMRRAVELDDRNASAHRGLGFILWEQGALEQAGEEWREGALPYADFTRVAAQAKRAEDSAKALDWYYRAIAMSPAASDAYASAASVLMGMGEQEQALPMAERALALEAFSQEWLEVSAHYNRADILRKTGRGLEAIAEYEWVVERRPNDYWAHIRLGALVWEVEQDVVRAESLFLRAVEINPAEKWAYGHLGDLYRESERPAEALQMYLKSLEIDPNDESVQKRVDALKAGDSQ